MGYDVELHILKLNFLEFLSLFLETKADLPMILELNERIYARNHATLPNSLLTVVTTLHSVKERLDRKEQIEIKSILNLVDDCVITLISSNKA